MLQKHVSNNTAHHHRQKYTDRQLVEAEHDLVIVGGGVAGYVAAIKAGQEGMKVLHACSSIRKGETYRFVRLRV